MGQTARAAYEELLTRYAESCDLSGASALLSWDQETLMPPRGAEARAKQLATLAGIQHERWSAPQVGELLQECESDSGEFNDEEAAATREMRREYDMSTRLPASLVQEFAAATSAALQVWREAREASDFTRFVPSLQKLIDLSKRKAEAYGYEEAPLDALLDLYERGATTSAIRTLFGELKGKLQALTARVLDKGDAVSPALLQSDFDEDRQGELGVDVIRQMGFNFDAGRVDLSTHPFCTTPGAGDTRLTRRFLKEDLRPGLFGVIHEAGHGLYEQGMPEKWVRHPLGTATSLGVHESQSRLWENIVARSLPFWEYFLPALQKYFPAQYRDATPEAVYQAVNHVEASFIRVEADELTYNLHVILRFEIESEIFSGQLDVADIPARWNRGMKDFLGITPPDDAQGCLQDIHWAMGGFGYFPTYTLGNLYSAQLFQCAQQALPDLDHEFRQGKFDSLREWLRTEVHQKGRMLEPVALIKSATKAEPTPEPFLRYVEEKMDEVYGLSTS